MFTKSDAVELGPYGIRVNCVAPGAIEIERTKLEAAGYSDAWANITPLRRIGTPEDVAGLVVFLASKEAALSADKRYGSMERHLLSLVGRMTITEHKVSLLAMSRR